MLRLGRRHLRNGVFERAKRKWLSHDDGVVIQQVGQLRGVIAGHEDDRLGRMCGTDTRERLGTRHDRHPHIQQDDIEVFARYRLQRLGSR